MNHKNKDQDYHDKEFCHKRQKIYKRMNCVKVPLPKKKEDDRKKIGNNF